MQQRLCCSPAPLSPQHICGVTISDTPSPAAVIRQWLRAVITDTGMSAPVWAKRAGVAASTVQRALKDSYEFTTSSTTLAKLAAVANRAPPEVRQVRDLQFVPAYLTVRFRVQAGHWIETDGEVHAPPDGMYPVAPDPNFSEFPQWLEEVVGDSINEEIPPGAFAHVVDAIEMGYEARSGDLVVVERRRGHGLLRERTIKEVVVTPEGVIELWPRSTNKKMWHSPVVLAAGARGNEDIEVEIVGFVVGHYKPRKRQL